MRLAFVLTLLFVASGCASADKAAPATAEMRDVDEAKMQQIEDQAARRGVRVYWINPPRKAAAQTGG
jgi:uncharacterized protein YceK